MDIKEKLKKIRLDHHQTQEDMANLFHVSRQTISSWENGRTYPNIDVLIKMSDYYKISLDDLIKEDNDMVDTFSNAIKKSKTRKRLILCLSLILLIIISANLITSLSNSRRNEHGLAPNDLLSHRFRLAYDPKVEIADAYLDFSKDSLNLFKKYKPIKPDTTPEKVSKTTNDMKESGKVDDFRTYQHIKVTISENQYLVTGDSFNETYTRVDSKRIKDTDGVEYIIE